MSAYYNEIDPFKAEVLRQAIAAGAIAPGEVDERSIADVQPADLVGFTQWHFFAGGGFWSLALRQSGWPDDRPVATLSCPCPSFSAAGKGKGFDDPRHLWPEAFRLIRECRFPVCIGEQVAAAIGHGWLDLVSGDMEAEGYAVAAAVLGAHSAGAPHIRQRLYFCAHADGVRLAGRRLDHGSDTESRRTEEAQRGQLRKSVAAHDDAGDRSHTAGARHDGPLGASEGDPRHEARMRVSGADGEPGQRGDSGHGHRAARLPGSEHESGASVSEQSGGAGAAGERSDTDQRGSQVGWSQSDAGMGGRDCSGEDAEGIGATAAEPDSRPVHGDDALGARLEGHFGDVREWRGPGWLDPLTARSVAAAGATRGFWADCDWWYGRDGKYRPAGPGVQPLAHGSPARVGRLRMYGDAICVPAAEAFIEAVMEVTA